MMHVRCLPVIAAALILFFAPAVASAEGDWNGDVNVSLGMKYLDEDDWDANDLNEIGIMANLKKEEWPLSMAIDLLYAKGDETVPPPFPYMPTKKYESTTVELNVGARKIWGDASSTARPFLGGGVSLVYALKESTSFDPLMTYTLSRSGMGPGLWIGGGVSLALGKHVSIGIDLRYTAATITLDDSPSAEYQVYAGGYHGGLFAGYRW